MCLMSNTTETNETPTRDKISPRVRLLATVGALMALALASIDASVVNAAMPHIVNDLKGLQLYSWVGISYGITSAVMIPIAGKLGDMFGRKFFLLTGIAGFMVFSFLCGISGTMTELVIFRGVQGLFGGILIASVFTMLGEVYERGRLAQMQGLFFSVAGLSMVLGPPVGGFITDTLGWRWVFFLNIGIGIIPLIAVGAVPFARTSAALRDIDYLGAITLIGGLVPILAGLSFIGDGHSVTSALVLILLVVGVVVLASFAYIETKVAANPIIPFGIFRTNQVAVMVTVGFFSAFAMSAAIFYVPLLYQGVLGVSAASSGSLLIPLTLALVIVPPLAGKALSKITHYRYLGTLAFAFMMAGLLMLTMVDANTGNVVPVVSMVLIGIGIGITFPMATSVAQSAVSMEQLGIVTSQVQFWRIIAGPSSLAILGPILSSRIGSASQVGGRVSGVSAAHLAGALHNVFLTAGLLIVIGLLATLVLKEVPLRVMPKPKSEPKKRRMQLRLSHSKA
jgi:EmrB/QacA subfamily drug resistance transporter